MELRKHFAVAAVAAISLLIGTPSVGQASSDAKASSEPTAEFSIVVTAVAGRAKVGAPIEAMVTITNVTDHTIYWSSERLSAGIYADLGFLLTKDGREVESTSFHQRMTGRTKEDDKPETYRSSRILLPHPPGKMFELKVNLRRLFQITAPGRYTLEVSRYDEARKTTVRSNRLTFTILPE